MRSTISAVVVTHTTTVFGPPQALASYLKKQTSRLVYIDHPLEYDRERRSRLEVWEEGKLVVEKSFPNWGSWSALNYLKDMVATLWLLMPIARGRAFDYYIGCDNLSCLPAIWLRRFFAFRVLIAYNVDYSTKRFLSPLMDFIYRWADRSTTRSADKIWCVTNRIAKVRQAMGRQSADVIVVPNGVYLDLIAATGKHDEGLVFAGHLVKEKGVDQLILALKQVSQMSLTIFGKGAELPTLERLVKDQGLSDRVTFGGFLTNAALLARLADYTIGVALYGDEASYVYYSDPIKVKEYLAAGLPVIMTDGPEIAQTITRVGAGSIISQASELGQAITEVTGKLKSMRAKAKAMSDHFDWQLIFDQALTASPVPAQRLLPKRS